MYVKVLVIGGRLVVSVLVIVVVIYNVVSTTMPTFQGVDFTGNVYVVVETFVVVETSVWEKIRNEGS